MNTRLEALIKMRRELNMLIHVERVAEAQGAKLKAICRYCREKFVVVKGNMKYCSPECNQLHRASKKTTPKPRTVIASRLPIDRSDVDHSNHQPEGHYVYAWFDGERLLYIGRGNTCYRFKSAHSPVCELLRGEAKEFRIRIYDGLTKKSAAALEGAMIRLLTPPGNALNGYVAPRNSDLSQLEILNGSTGPQNGSADQNT